MNSFSGWIFCLIIVTASAYSAESPQPSIEQKSFLRMNFSQPIAARHPLAPIPAEVIEASRNNFPYVVPDKRILHALIDLRSIVGGFPREKVSLKKADKTVEILLNDRSVGQLEDLPSFSSAMDLLNRGYESLPKRSFSINQDATPPKAEWAEMLSRYQPEEIFLELNKISDEWNAGKKTKVNLIWFTKLYTRLASMHVDNIGISDQFYGRALAFLFLTKKLTGEKMAQEEAELAIAFGYSKHAEDRLPEIDPNGSIYKYFKLPAVEFLNLIQESKANLEDRFYFYRKFVPTRRSKPIDESGDSLGGGLFPNGLLHSYFYSCENFCSMYYRHAKNMPQIMNRQIESLFMTKNLSSPQLIFEKEKWHYELLAKDIPETEKDSLVYAVKNFEQNLAKAMTARKDGLWDFETTMSYSRGYFYSGVMVSFDYFQQFLGDAAGTKLFLESIRPYSQVGVGKDVFQWLESNADHQGKIWTLDGLQQSVLGKTQYQMLLERGGVRDRPILKAIRDVIESLDSRPSTLVYVNSMCFNYFMDNRCTKRFSTAILKAIGSDQQPERQMAEVYDRNPKEVYASFANGSANAAPSLELAEFFYASKEHSVTEKEEILKFLIKADSANWDVRKFFVEHLMREERYVEAIDYLTPFIALNDADGTLRPAFARSMLAECYLKLGQPRLALKAVEPALASGALAPMAAVAEIYLKMGDYEKAKATSFAAMERYPNAAVWRDQVQAMALLLKGDVKLATNDICRAQWWVRGNPYLKYEEFYVAFFDVFYPTDDAAFTALKSIVENGCVSLASFAESLYERKRRPALLLRIVDSFASKDKENAARWLPIGYATILQQRGEKAAQKWAERLIIDPKDGGTIAKVLFEEKEYGLLVDLVNLRKMPVLEAEEYFFPLILASSAISGKKINPETSKVMQEVAAKKISHASGRAATYMLGGGASEKAFIESQSFAEFIAAGGFAAGIKAYFGDKDQERGLQWLRVSFEMANGTDSYGVHSMQMLRDLNPRFYGSVPRRTIQAKEQKTLKQTPNIFPKERKPDNSLSQEALDKRREILSDVFKNSFVYTLFFSWKILAEQRVFPLAKKEATFPFFESSF